MTATSPIEVRDMAIIRQTFRRAYKEAAQLVRYADAVAGTCDLSR
jgi:hypothetical protein